MNKTPEVAQRYRSAAYWWIATELLRRNRDLELFETYPMDGFYDCLTLSRQFDHPVHIDLNRFGSIHVHPDHIGLLTAEDAISRENAHEAVKEVERAAGLSPMDSALASDGRLIVLRVLAAALNYLVNDRYTWDARMVSLDGFGLSKPIFKNDVSSWKAQPFSTVFPREEQFHAFIVSAGFHSAIEVGRLWALQREGVPVAVFDTRGMVYTRDAHVALKPLYSRTNRNLSLTMMQALGHILP